MKTYKPIVGFLCVPATRIVTTSRSVLSLSDACPDLLGAGGERTPFGNLDIGAFLGFAPKAFGVGIWSFALECEALVRLAAPPDPNTGYKLPITTCW